MTDYRKVGLLAFLFLCLSLIPSILFALDGPLNDIAMDYLEVQKSESIYGDGEYNFAIISDTHISTTNAFSGSYFEDILTEVSDRKNTSDRISFIILAGDATENGTTANLDEYYDNVVGWMDASGGDYSKIPIMHVLGNHEPSSSDAGSSKNTADRMIAYFGEPDFTFEYDGSVFALNNLGWSLIENSAGCSLIGTFPESDAEVCSLEKYYLGDCTISQSPDEHCWSFYGNPQVESTSCGTTNRPCRDYSIQIDQLNILSESFNNNSYTYKFSITHVPTYYTYQWNNTFARVDESRSELFQDALIQTHATATFAGHIHTNTGGFHYTCNEGSGVYNIPTGLANSSGQEWVIVNVTNESVIATNCDNAACISTEREVNLVDYRDELTTDENYIHQARIGGDDSGDEVHNGDDIDITAGSRITFLPGFSTEQGAVLAASISCSGF